MGKPNTGNAKPFTPNEVVSLEQKLRFVLGQLKAREAELTALLPVDIPFDTFYALINQGLRNNPKILACTGVSIVNACVEAAYDGLRLDGKEAALVDHNVNVGTKQLPVWEQHAEYFPMVRGLIKKILQSDRVLAMDVDVIHENDPVKRIVGGTVNRRIEHEPLLSGDRGKPIIFYTIAVLPGGLTTFEYMTIADVMDVRKEAKTQYVWDRWFGEMGKKSVVRRHEKRLPSGRDMKPLVDLEAKKMFPQFDKTAPHPQLAAPQTKPVRPAAVEDQSGTAAGQVFDAGAGKQDRFEESKREDDQGQRAKPAAKAEPEPAKGEAAEEEQLTLPDDWDAWAADLETQIGAADKDEVHPLWQDHDALLKAAPPAIRDRLTSCFTARLADLVE